LTKSGLAVKTLEAERKGRRVIYAIEHPYLVRFAHWLNAVTLLVLTTSGLQIFAAFPSFGDKIPQRDLLAVPGFLRLGGWLGGALQWHFTFMWIFIATGAVYLVYQFASGRWRQSFFLPRDAGGVWPMIRHYFLFRPQPEPREPYNPLQKLAYTATILGGAVSVATGALLYQPAQLAPLVALAGGFGMVRLYHFAAMVGFLAFIPGHLLMVALHGWNNFNSMLTGWKRDPGYLKENSIKPWEGADRSENRCGRSRSRSTGR
jgi:thiosulfate reductase cytochrome b subunit